MLEEPQPIQDPVRLTEEPPAAPPPSVVPDPLNKFELLLKSRKFWAALVGLALVITKGYRPDFPIQDDQLTGLVVIIVGYILGTSIEDSAHPTPPKVS
jgi:hypothetical protein